MMEKQRSFSIKRTNFLALSLILSSSLVFLIFLSIETFKSTPLLLVHQDSNFQALNSSATEATTQITKATLFREPENQGGFANLSRFEGIFVANKSGSQVLGDIEDRDSAGTISSERESIWGGTHIKKPGNVSGFAVNFVFERLNRIKNVTHTASGALSVTLSSRKQNVSATLFEKSENTSSGESYRVCDFTKGKWVYDERLPLYTNSTCLFIDEGFNCEGNGRLDKDYLKWRWQPQDCEIPRFNATEMLELIRGKRLVFVGDSINRNQWESMLCLLMGAIKEPKKVYETRGRRITKEKGNYSFKFVDYDCTVEYYVSHFLVHESKARVGKKRVSTLRIDTMDRSSLRWKGADVLVFNTAHWWNHYKTKAGINYYQEGNQVYSHLDASVAFRRSLSTWASWLDRYVNPRKTHVFFRSSSPSHFRGGQWNSGGHCKEATQPLGNLPVTNNPEKNIIVEEVISRMRTPVTILNISRMSEYRIDGHPSSYGRSNIWRRSSSNVQDCSHWCLPGVPDTWNELLYTILYLKRRV